jgi:hypothetical protein
VIVRVINSGRESFWYMSPSRGDRGSRKTSSHDRSGETGHDVRLQVSKHYAAQSMHTELGKIRMKKRSLHGLNGTIHDSQIPL